MINNEKADLGFTYPGFSIQYINNEKGLRQNFIIDKDLGGIANLEVLIQAKGALTPSLNNNGLIFKDDIGKTKFFYNSLKVWDANNRLLEARMELRGMLQA